ncbi:MAG: GntR family transcriptional regulator, partial [Lachnospiraceae bacterium]|nr:GntR family transcriptional regulator [Lachnospiraceae bacterium]
LIIGGGLEANSKLPSVRALAMELSVNPNTIQRAYAQLEQDGYIYTILGRGNYVTDKSEWQDGHFKTLRADFTELLKQAHAAGMPQAELFSLIKSIYGED